ncbi:hypothetical protein DID76_00615 [Candidatus Marinamargulisbacteria bacterium SCGC AG-414-C22]|nr:hypothetical protein DID76_00615 [Candidatus Marinamargulisbacteria bacterium SCGC AG-414-C22]
MESLQFLTKYANMGLISFIAFILGSATQLNASQKPVVYPLLLLNLFSGLTALTTYTIRGYYHIENDAYIMLSMLFFVVLVSLATAFFFKNKTASNTFFSFLFTGTLGLLLGMVQFNAAAILLIFVMVVSFIWYLLRKFQLILPQRSIAIECLTEDGLNYIQKLFAMFRISIDQQDVKHDHTITCKFSYRAPAITQHILLKKLFSYPGIGAINIHS